MTNGTKETVIRRSGDTFAFSLPEEHTFDVLDETDEAGRPLARIGVTGVAGEMCSVLGVEEREHETEYLLEPAGFSSSVGSQPTGYPWTSVQEEHARLRARWQNAGGEPTRFEAWRQGASHESQFREWRDEIRRMESGTG